MSTKKEQTRERMRDAASRSFRSHGFAGVGVDAIAKAAGVTSGAFYAHFGSKDGAFRDALEQGLDEVIGAIPQYQSEHGADWVRAFADYYLGKAHRDDLACGCAMTTLSPEVARSEPEVKALFETKMKKIAGLVADGLPGGDEEQRLSRAWSVLGVLIGGLTLARSVKSNRLAEQIGKSIRRAAVDAASLRAREDD
ncbi:TetR family transcriptional regulator [Methylosinus sp. C49]|uniref:TetR/AcrR family transcriptional regulator n=1 Tax=Methylosinus sp. C49 TaxID=2699395 RepID=UPI0013673F84|nr:TetR/AcrR family transcriptional regulator [Methylosinus sp. C49]BBU60134.1 TetR family transcriptional regulator [Methylosinus sp. C49]